MNVSRVILTNFKGFEKKEFKFPTNFTVLIGDNATGKTSILDALSVALGSFFIGIDSIAPRTIRTNEIRVKTIDGQPKPQMPVCIEAEGVIDDKLVRWKREIINSKTTQKGAKTLSDIAKHKLQESRTVSGVDFPVFAYYSTGRLWAEHEKIDFQAQAEGVLLAYTNCLSAKSSSKEFLSWYKTQEDSVLKFSRPLDKAHLTAFKNTILGLLNNDMWNQLSFDYKENELQFYYQNPDTQELSNFYKYSQLSDGYRAVISLAADIAYRCIQLNPHYKEQTVLHSKGVVLIDELDLHLHPKWQRRIVGDLKRVFPNIQFIVTTHSPFIIQSLLRSELINLDENNAIVDDYYKYGIEDITENTMGVADVHRSARFLEMERIAKAYYNLLEQGGDAAHIAELDNQLKVIEIEYNHDPAFTAWLKLQRLNKKL